MERIKLMFGLLILLVVFILSFAVYIYSIFFNTSKAYKLLVSYDQTMNVLLNGHEDETVSSRAAKARLSGNRWGCLLCKVLDKIDPNHCTKSIEKDRGKIV